MTTIASLTFTQVVLFLHIASVVVAFGVTFTYPIIVPATIQRAPRHAAWLHGMQDRIGRFIITPGATLVLLTERDIAASPPTGDVAWSQEYQDLGRQVGMVGAFVSLLILVVIFIMVVGPTL
jgi:hypothetical protein